MHLPKCGFGFLLVSAITSLLSSTRHSVVDPKTLFRGAEKDGNKLENNDLPQLRSFVNLRSDMSTISSLAGVGNLGEKSKCRSRIAAAANPGYGPQRLEFSAFAIAEVVLPTFGTASST